MSTETTESKASAPKTQTSAWQIVESILGQSSGDKNLPWAQRASKLRETGDEFQAAAIDRDSTNECDEQSA